MKKLLIPAFLLLLTGTAWAGGKTIWFSSYEMSGNTGANMCAPFMGTTELANDLVLESQLIPTDGALSHLYVSVSAAPGSGKSWTFTHYVNGSSTDCAACTISNSETTCSSTTSKAVSAGDYVSVKIEPSGTPAAARISFTTQFTATEDAETAWGSAILSAISTDPTMYAPIAGTRNASGDEPYMYVVMPFDATLTKLYVKLTTAPGAGNSRTFVISKNGSGQADPSVTISDTATTGNDTATLDLAAGDLLTIKSTLSGTPANTYAQFGVCIVPDTEGNFGIPVGMSGDLSAAADRYFPIGDQGGNPSDTEANTQNYFQTAETVVLKGAYIKTMAAPGADKSYTFHLRDNAGDASPDLDVTIANTDTTGSSSENLTPTVGHFLNWIIHPTGTPTATRMAATLIGYIAPPASTTQNNLLMGVGP